MNWNHDSKGRYVFNDGGYSAKTEIHAKFEDGMSLQVEELSESDIRSVAQKDNEYFFVAVNRIDENDNMRETDLGEFNTFSEAEEGAKEYRKNHTTKTEIENSL